MKNKITITGSIKKEPSKTNWDRVISQTDNEILRNIKTDPDSALLNNKKYYKPENNNEQC